MFYSHEILTSRKYGVATVWLIGTLGPKSTALKVKRKQILGVDVKKACETIIQPEAPMALRLQSSLLYGVSRVYSQQCGYVLHDAQAAQSSMRALLKVVRSNAIDLDEGTARPDQLIIMDDPAFEPCLALPSLPELDFNTLNQAFDDSQYSMLSSLKSPSNPRIAGSSQASNFGLQIPPSDNDITGQFQLPGHFHLGSSAQKTPSAINIFDDGDIGLLDDVDFEFDADGAIVEMNTEDLERRRTRPYPVEAGRSENDLAASKRVRRDHDYALVGRSAPNVPQEGDDFIIQIDDDMNILPDAEAFPNRKESGLPGNQESGFEESSISADFLMKKRKRKALKVISDLDIRLDIRNSEISEWQTNYVQNMRMAKQSKTLRAARQYAMANAAIFIWDNGVGGIGKTIRSAGNISHPLDIFRGDKLRAFITGVVSIPSQGNKRARPAFDENDEEIARNVRARSDLDPQLPRTGGDDVFAPNFDDDIMLYADDSIATEVGREAQSPLADHHSSAMPWNISSSLNSFRLKTSSVPRGQGRQSSVVSGRPGSRLPSASPLLGRGKLVSDNETERTHLSPGAASPSALENEEFMAFGPSAAVDTQTAQNSQWVADALETESLNFLEFVRCSAVDAEDGHESQHLDDIHDGSRSKWVGFETLFPPHEIRHIVAAQAFYHILSLSTKNMLKVSQEEDGNIRMRVHQ